MKHWKYTLRQSIVSFKYAFNGLKILVKEEHNFRIHLLATVLVVAFGLYFRLNVTEWMAIIFAIGFVLVSEIVNTVFENLSDIVSPEFNKKIGKIKDVAAAAVLVAAFVAFAIGCFVFLPKFILLF